MAVLTHIGACGDWKTTYFTWLIFVNFESENEFTIISRFSCCKWIDGRPIYESLFTNWGRLLLWKYLCMKFLVSFSHCLGVIIWLFFFSTYHFLFAKAPDCLGMRSGWSSHCLTAPYTWLTTRWHTCSKVESSTAVSPGQQTFSKLYCKTTGIKKLRCLPTKKKRCSIPAGQVELSQHRDNFTFSWHYSEFHG